MKRIILFFFILTSLASAGQSYQKWIVFGTERYQITPAEMADVTNALYQGLIKPNTWYKLSTGAIYKIAQPKLYLTYIERCVRVSDPSATTSQKVIMAIKNGERLGWGTDVSIRVKNYWYSSVKKTVTHTDNYTGFQIPSDFIFINGIPTIKCDCGNPLEAINIFTPTPVIEEKKEKIPAPLQLPVVPTTQEEPPTLPKNLGELRAAILSGSTPVQQPIIPSVKRNWRPVLVIGGIVVATAGLGYLAYTLLKSKPTITPDPGGPVDPTGGDVGGPVDPSGGPVGP